MTLNDDNSYIGLYRPAEVLCLYSIDVKQSQLNWSRTTNQVIRKLIESKGHS